MNVSDEILKRTADSYRRIRNTLRFLLANLNDFDPAKDKLDAGAMLDLDRWAVARTAALHAGVIKAYDDFEFHRIYQELHNFCVLDMGGFYLDIIKDRQYTTQKNGKPRRSAQTAIHYTLEAMVRWLAPIMSFTAEEIWRHAPGDRGASVFLEGWYELPDVYPAKEAQGRMDLWEQIRAVREDVSRELEKLRAAGSIGSSLDAEVDLYCDEKLSDALAGLDGELRFVLITSYARVHPAQERPADAEPASTLSGRLWIKAMPSRHGKCIRCWHHREDVGAHSEHPDICARCITNITGQGETRRYA